MSNLQAVYNEKLSAMQVLDKYGDVVDIVKTQDANTAILMAQAKLDRLNPFKDSVWTE